MPDDTTTWEMIHSERRALVDTLDGLTAEQWDTPSLCTGWTVKLAAAHIVVGAEQTPARFFQGMVANGFQFNKMMDRNAHRLGVLTPGEIVERLRARTATTNHPPGPAAAMLGEVVVHGEDIRRPLGLRGDTGAAATVACLEMYKGANFPVGTEKRIRGLRLIATDAAWSQGAGPEVSGPGLSLLMAMTGPSGRPRWPQLRRRGRPERRAVLAPAWWRSATPAEKAAISDDSSDFGPHKGPHRVNSSQIGQLVRDFVGQVEGRRLFSPSQRQ